MSAISDTDALRLQYGSDACLRVRQDIHGKYSVPQLNFTEWVLKRVTWRGDETILDLGSGPGAYYPYLSRRYPGITYHGLDRSGAMLTNHPAPNNLLQADAQQLPYADSSFDVVMANHMLYHIPDIDAAVREIKRVLKPSGVLVASTNSIQTMPEFQALFHRGLLLLSTPGNVYARFSLAEHAPFTLENGTGLLSRHFFAVVRHDLPGLLVFPDVEPVMAYLESWRSIREPQLPQGVKWDDLMLIVREQISRVVSHFGELTVQKISGVLVASSRGGFIKDFVARSGGGAS